MIESEQSRREEVFAKKMGALEHASTTRVQRFWLGFIALAGRTAMFQNTLKPYSCQFGPYDVAAARVIQRKWSTSMERTRGKMFRKAVRVVRKHSIKAVYKRSQEKRVQSADRIIDFLGLYEHVNFIKVMRNYRFRVICCQRFLRSFNMISRARMKLLLQKWDVVENEYWKKEKDNHTAKQRRESQQFMEVGGSLH